MFSISSIFYILVLFLVANSAAPNRCNVYNLGMQGIYQCGLEWWQREDLGQVVPVKYKLSDYAKGAMFVLFDYSSVNSSLSGRIMANSSDPLAKIIESGLTVEPYLSFIIADILEGYDITKAELQTFGLPVDLATKSNLVQMFKEYFEFSCTR